MTNKTYREKIKLENKIKRYNKIRDDIDSEGYFKYNFITRIAAIISSKYYTKKWELWNE